jgi:hypothetical protein
MSMFRDLPNAPDIPEDAFVAVGKRAQKNKERKR